MGRKLLSRRCSPSFVGWRRAKTTGNISARSRKSARPPTAVADRDPTHTDATSLAMTNAMTDDLDGVRDHYRATGLTGRLKTALAGLGPDDQRLTPRQLAALDQFHTRGLAATADLARLAGLAAGMSVLDVGAGVGGPARFLA